MHLSHIVFVFISAAAFLFGSPAGAQDKFEFEYKGETVTQHIDNGEAHSLGWRPQGNNFIWPDYTSKESDLCVYTYDFNFETQKPFNTKKVFCSNENLKIGNVSMSVQQGQFFRATGKSIYAKDNVIVLMSPVTRDGLDLPFALSFEEFLAVPIIKELASKNRFRWTWCRFGNTRNCDDLLFQAKLDFLNEELHAVKRHEALCLRWRSSPHCESEHVKEIFDYAIKRTEERCALQKKGACETHSKIDAIQTRYNKSNSFEEYPYTSVVIANPSLLEELFYNETAPLVCGSTPAEMRKTAYSFGWENEYDDDDPNQGEDVTREAYQQISALRRFSSARISKTCLMRSCEGGSGEACWDLAFSGYNEVPPKFREKYLILIRRIMHQGCLADDDKNCDNIEKFYRELRDYSDWCVKFFGESAKCNKSLKKHFKSIGDEYQLPYDRLRCRRGDPDYCSEVYRVLYNQTFFNGLDSIYSQRDKFSEAYSYAKRACDLGGGSRCADYEEAKEMSKNLELHQVNFEEEKQRDRAQARRKKKELSNFLGALVGAVSQGVNESNGGQQNSVSHLPRDQQNAIIRNQIEQNRRAAKNSNASGTLSNPDGQAEITLSCSYESHKIKPGTFCEYNPDWNKANSDQYAEEIARSQCLGRNNSPSWGNSWSWQSGKGCVSSYKPSTK